jgi:tetratricopeptide (TPR) repeat protein
LKGLPVPRRPGEPDPATANEIDRDIGPDRMGIFVGTVCRRPAALALIGVGTMKRHQLSILVALAVLVLAVPAMAGDCILLKSGKYHQPGPVDGSRAPMREDYDKSMYTVLTENYDKVDFSMKLQNGKTTKQSYDTAKVDTVYYWPQPPAFTAAAKLMGTGDYPTAIDKFTAVYKDRSQRFWARVYSLLNIAMMYEADGNWAQAVATWELLAKDFPKSRYTPKAYIQAGLAHMNLNDSAAARNSFSRLTRLSGLPEGQKALAQYYLILIKEKEGEKTKNQGLLRQALGEYEALLSKVGDDEEMRDVAIMARLGIGNCRVLLGQYDEALAFFQKIADSAKDKAVLAGAYNGLGDCYIKKNDWKSALMAFLRTEILYDENPEQTARALYLSGRCFQFMKGAGQGEDSGLRARAQYQKCIRRFPSSSWAQQARDALPTVR